MVRKFSGNFVLKLGSTFRDTPVSPLGMKIISLPFAKLSSFQSLINRKQLREIELQIVSAISFSWFADFGKTLTIVQRTSLVLAMEKGFDCGKNRISLLSIFFL